MTFTGKDYCNCEHAQMLRAAIEAARRPLLEPGLQSHARLERVAAILRKALELDAAMAKDYHNHLAR